jgi:hypothetical protein
MIWLALAAGYGLFLLFAWSLCVVAGRADAGDDPLDDSAEWLGIGSDSFPHDRDYH